jgi:hypothetical protein
MDAKTYDDFAKECFTKVFAICCDTSNEYQYDVLEKGFSFVKLKIFRDYLRQEQKTSHKEQPLNNEEASE